MRVCVPLPPFAPISIHALHEESDGGLLDVDGNKEEISIHALHEESDQRTDMYCTTTSAISIHALHEESDQTAAPSWPMMKNFNPRSP